MQNAKDTFYEILRGRLTGVNPERTVAVRGVTRPGLLVDENELPLVAALPDCFHLQWGETVADAQGGLPTVTLTCAIGYATAGSGMNGGMDRGRALAAMDGELLAAVGQCPRSALKNDYSALASGGSACAMSTRVWWSDVAFGTVKVNGDRLTRVATVEVMSYQEQGE